MSVTPGLCSITHRQLAADDVVALAARSGLVGIEWGADVHAPPGDLAHATALSARCSDAGLVVASYGSYHGATPDDGGPAQDVHAVLDTAEALGAPLVRAWTEFGVLPDAPDADRGRVAERLGALADAAAERGLLVAIEYHPGTLTDTARSTLGLLASLGRPNLRTHWQPDPRLTDAEALASLEAVLPHLAHLHVFRWGPGGYVDRRPLAEGVELWPAAIAAAGGGITADLPRFALLEFVLDDLPEQCSEDARTLAAWCAARG